MFEDKPSLVLARTSSCGGETVTSTLRSSGGARENREKNSARQGSALYKIIRRGQFIYYVIYGKNNNRKTFCPVHIT